MGRMDHEGFSIQRIKLRAFDLSERTSRLGKASIEQRIERLRSRAFMIVQTSITAGVAWWLAQTVLGHRAPTFAAVAAILCLGMTYGQRIRRGIEVAIGVAVGIGVGDLFVFVFGSGTPQIIVVIALSLSVAILLGAGQLMIIQAAVQSIVVTTLLPFPGEGFGRWLDAVLGCALALVVATVAPSSPVRRPRFLAAQVLQELAGTLEAAGAALRADDPEAANAVLDRARHAEAGLNALTAAADEGLAVVRLSPFRRGQLPAVQAYAEFAQPLDRASRNLRVLARQGASTVWRGNSVPLAYIALLDSVAEISRFMAEELYNNRLPSAARGRLVAVAEASSHVRLAHSISAVVILAQTRSIVVDLLQLTGLDYVDARELLPEMD